MNEIISYLIASGYGDIVGWLILGAFILIQIRPHLPPKVTEKIPDWVMWILNGLAAKYKHGAPVETDFSGNPK